MGRGGLARGDWSRDLIPGGIARKNGVAPDVLAAEGPSECPEAGWNPDDGSEGMLLWLQTEYEKFTEAWSQRGFKAPHKDGLPPTYQTDPQLPAIRLQKTFEATMHGYLADLMESGDAHNEAAAKVVGTLCEAFVKRGWLAPVEGAA